MLTRKILAMFIIGFCLLAVADYTLVYYTVLPGYRNLERRDAITNVDRCRSAFERELEHLETFCTDWANWDDTYRYVQDHNPAFARGNLTDNTFIEARIDLIYIVDLQGNVVWGRVFDPIQQQEITLAALPDSLFTPQHTLFATESKPVRGILSTERYPLLVASQAILTTRGDGPSPGFIVMGRFLTPAYIQQLREQTHVNFSLLPESEATRTEHVNLADKTTLFVPASENTLDAYVRLDNVLKGMNYIIHAGLPRDILQEGFRTIRVIWLTVLAVGACLILLLLLLLQVTVLRPIARLRVHAEQISQSGVLDHPLYSRRRDEIGILARQFDQTVSQLIDIRLQLTGLSYRAGLTEMSARLLHNFRNQLTPLEMQVERIRKNLQQLSTEKLEIARAEIEKPDISPSRRLDVSHYMHLYFEKIDQIAGDLRNDFELWDMTRQQMEKLLADQDMLTANPVYEQVLLSQWIERILATLPHRLQAEAKTRIHGNTEQMVEFPRLQAEYGLLHLLGNITNKFSEQTLSLELSVIERELTILLYYSASLPEQIVFDRQINPELHDAANLLRSIGAVIDSRPGMLAIRLPFNPK